jgi:hypothetical protein
MRLFSIVLTFILSGSLFGQTYVGSMAQLASGGSWTTTITLVNTGTTDAQVLLNFADDNGNALIVPLIFPQSPSPSVPLLLATFGTTLKPGALFLVASTGPDIGPPRVGWVQVIADTSISGFATIRQQRASSDQQAAVPLETRNAGAYLLSFDNTNGFVAGVALANTSAQSGNVGVIIRDDTGTILQSTTIPLEALGHTSFVLSSSYSFTEELRGTVEFDTPAGGQISVLGIQYNTRTGAFSTIPAIAK